MKKIFSLLLFLGMMVDSSAFALKLPSTDFLRRLGKHCTGYCDQKNITCTKGVDKQGYYDWCKKNCLHKDKTDRESFVKAIEFCDTVPSRPSMPSAAPSGPSMPSAEPNMPPPLPQFDKTFLGKIVEGDKEHGFKVQIVAQKGSGGSVQSGEFVFIHPDKISDDMEINMYVQMGTISSKALPAYNYGRLKIVQDKPSVVR